MTDNVRAPISGRNLDNFFAATVSFRASESVYATVKRAAGRIQLRCAAGCDLVLGGIHLALALVRAGLTAQDVGFDFTESRTINPKFRVERGRVRRSATLIEQGGCLAVANSGGSVMKNLGCVE
jgi:hypothetical protein